MFRPERLACTAMVVSMAASLASAQEDSIKSAGIFQKWVVYVHEAADRKMCFAASRAQRKRNTREGKPVSVNRSIEQISVMFEPSKGRDGEVSYTGGYPYDPQKTVKLTVSGNTFTLYVDGEWAWTGSPDEDRKVHEAFRRGATAIITGVSARGTTTSDTISLIGFTDAFNHAKKLCS
ncbi:MAG: hypothetical protein OXF88_03830 [Rhodobacteraceae bacterium]|nr:hypothetical protein [Paracoccaceae bacterium]MCY4139838.1 hypothetical protein [Paracoccaceae bacterium]